MKYQTPFQVTACILVLLLSATAVNALPGKPGGGDDQAAEETLVLLKKVNAWQKANPWRETDRCWIRGTYYTGVMELYRTTKDPSILKQAVDWGKKHDWDIGDPQDTPVNKHTCGQTWLELYALDPQPNRIEKVRAYADERIRSIPADQATGKGKWSYVDTIYVAPPTYAMLSEVTGDSKYRDYMHKVFWNVTDHLFDEEYGLYYRDKRFFKRESPNGKKIFWSRGNGWAFAGISRIIAHLPEDDPQREKYIKLFRTIAKSIIELQHPDGLWRSNLTDPDHCPEPETSGTAFFCAGLGWGLNKGILDKETYLVPTLKAWAGLVRHVNEEGRLGYVQQVAADPYSTKPDQWHEYATGLFLIAGCEISRILRSDIGNQAAGKIREFSAKPAGETSSPETPKTQETQEQFKVFARNGGWCWFQDPRAIIHDSKLIVGSLSGSGEEAGDVRVSVYDLAKNSDLGTVILNRGLQCDDHNAPAFYVRPDNRVLAVYAKHVDPIHHYRISEPNNPMKWGEEMTFEHPRSISYMNLYYHSADDTLYNFYRNTGGDKCPTFMVSKDHGTTWEHGTRLIHHGVKGRQRPYPRYWSDGQYIHVSFTQAHPQDFSRRGGYCGIYYAKYKGGIFYRADGTKIKELEKDGSLSSQEAEMIFEGTPGNSAWTSATRVDEEGNVALAYSVRKSRSDHRFRYAYWDGKTWIDNEFAFAGPGLYPAAYDYTGLVTIDPTDLARIWFSTNVDPVEGTSLPSGKHEMYEGVTADGGKSWKFTPVTTDSPEDNLRPICLAGEGYKVLLWLRGRYTSFVDYNQDVVGLITDLSQ